MEYESEVPRIFQMRAKVNNKSRKRDLASDVLLPDIQRNFPIRVSSCWQRKFVLGGGIQHLTFSLFYVPYIVIIVLW